ncbi:hypothetical protein ZWY2020_054145 [Hordeum vulgare]|nr:hypothetical protein ZWY2020_054145 [Hordeum vulgare]
MRTRKRRREVPSSGRPKRIALAADQPSPLSTGGGGGGRAASPQSQPVAAEPLSTGARQSQPAAAEPFSTGGGGDGRAADRQSQPAAAEPFSTGGGGDGSAADRQSQPAAEHELHEFLCNRPQINTTEK